MHTVLETAATYEVGGPVVVGVIAFAILAAGLAFVRQVGKFRPHSR